MEKVAPSIGDVYAFPLSHFDRGELKDVRLDVFGVAKVLAFDGKCWFFATLETFAETPAKLDVEAKVLEQAVIDELPHRGGKTIFFRGADLPEDWELVANIDLNEEEKELATLYDTWKSPEMPGFTSQTAYEDLGSVFEDLGGLSTVVGIEWRMRFELDQILQELGRRKPKAEPAKPTWEDVSTATINSGTDELRTHLQPAYDALIAVLQTDREKSAVQKALQDFFRIAYRHRMSGEYRDEIATIGADVGEACGLDRKTAYQLAELEA